MINISEIRPIIKEIMLFPFGACRYNMIEYADIMFETDEFQSINMVNDICYNPEFWMELASRVQLEIMHIDPKFIPDDALTVMVYKHNNYGAKGLLLVGIPGIAIYVTGKLFRMENMTKNKRPDLVNESIKDTLIDTYNYCILAILLIRNQIHKD